jgi:hypothetical protein
MDAEYTGSRAKSIKLPRFKGPAGGFAFIQFAEKRLPIICKFSKWCFRKTDLL